MKLNTHAANQFLALLGTMFDGGHADIYTIVPANADTAVSGIKLGSAVIAADSFAAPVGRAIAGQNFPWEDVAADADGAAASASFFSADGLDRMDLTVTVTAGAGELKVTSVNFLTGDPIRITGLSITLPA